MITFEPHPREVLAPDRAPPGSRRFRVKARLLAELGVGHLFALAFNEHLMRKSPEQFVHDVLAGGLGVRHVVIGFDFRFGHERAGDAEGPAALGADYDFGVTRIEPVAWRGEVCSSSRVREAVAHGDVGLARDLLGHPFLVEGRVVAGERRGRELGYPTANLRPGPRGLWPANGIYAVRATWDAREAGLARCGREPRGASTFDGGDRVLEVHLFEREVDLYGRRLCCAFVERLRAETTFATVEDLKAQMNQDSVAARAALAAAAS